MYFVTFCLHPQSIEFFFFAALIFGVTIIFAIMSFFYKYVDPAQLSHSDQSDTSTDSGGPIDESSALVMDRSQPATAADNETNGTADGTGYATGNDDLDFDFESTSKSALSAESDF